MRSRRVGTTRSAFGVGGDPSMVLTMAATTAAARSRRAAVTEMIAGALTPVLDHVAAWRLRPRPGAISATGCCHGDGGVVLKIGQQISVAVNIVGAEGVPPK